MTSKERMICALDRGKPDRVHSLLRILLEKKLTLILMLAAIGLAGFGCAGQKVHRYGMVLGLKEEKIPEYTGIHADVWPAVLKMIEDCNIKNYSIYLHQLDDGRHYLFA